MLLARPAFILLAQGITFLILRQLNVQNAAVAIRNWFSVYGTLADFGCLGLMFLLTWPEGIRLLDLIGFVKSKLKNDVLLGLGIFIIVFPVTIFGFGRLALLITDVTRYFPNTRSSALCLCWQSSTAGCSGGRSGP